MKGQSRLDVRKYSFSQRIVNEWTKLSADCVHSIVALTCEQNRQLYSKDRIHIDSYRWTLDKPTASLSAAIRAVAWMAILFNLVKI